MEGADWSRDRKIGEEFEQRVIGMLKGKYDLEKMNGRFPQYDLKCRRTGFTIECKTDAQMEKYGNIIIETKGLRDCIADILLYENRVTGDIYYIDWPELKYWVGLAIELGDYQESVVGENKTKGYKIPISDTIAYMNKWRVK